MFSIIITTYHEPETLTKTIEIILKEEITEPYEMLVVGPDQATEDIVKKFQKNNTQIFYLKDEHRGKPAALNLAFQHARGDILILTDGDVIIKQGSIKQLIMPFHNQRVGAVTGRPITTNPKNNLFGYWAHFLTNAAHQLRLKSKSFPCSGYLYAFRKNLISSIPAYTLSEDGLITQIIREKKYQIVYVPEAIVFVKYPTNFHDWLLQKQRSTGGYKQKLNFSINKERNFSGEISGGIKLLFTYPKSIKEFYWTALLCLARIYLWLIILIKVKILRQSFAKGWPRIESTK